MEMEKLELENDGGTLTVEKPKEILDPNNRGIFLMGAEAAIYKLLDDIGNALTPLIGITLASTGKTPETKMSQSSARRTLFIIRQYRRAVNSHSLEVIRDNQTREIELASPITPEERENMYKDAGFPK